MTLVTMRVNDYVTVVFSVYLTRNLSVMSDEWQQLLKNRSANEKSQFYVWKKQSGKR